MGRHHVGDDRQPGDALEGAEAGHRPRQNVEQPDLIDVEGGGDGKRQGSGRQRRLGAEQEPAAVEPVGNRTAVEGKDDQWTKLDRSKQACEERRPRDDVDLVGQCNERRLGAEAGEEGAGLEQAEVARLAQRANVDDEPAPPAPPQLRAHERWSSTARSIFTGGRIATPRSASRRIAQGVRALHRAPGEHWAIGGQKARARSFRARASRHRRRNRRGGTSPWFEASSS